MGRDKDMQYLRAVENAQLKAMRPTQSQRAVYLLMAIVTVLSPVPIFRLSVQANVLVIAVVTLFSALIVTFGYHNTFFSVRARLMAKREGKGGAPKGQQAKNTAIEATAFSVLYNNCIFLLSATMAAFFVFSSASNTTSYVLSVSSGAAFTTLLSASQL